MSENKAEIHNIATVSSDVGDAVGVANAKWFIAIVNNNTEKANAERLDKLGVKNYLPTQTVFRIWKNGKKARIVRVVIPTVIFIHCTEKERRKMVALPFINRFMTDKAGGAVNSASKPIATVSNEEIEKLKFMLGQSDIPITLTERPYKVGDRVRVIRGSLNGLEGEVLDMRSSKSELTVSLTLFGCARLVIDTINLKLIKEN